MKLLFIHSDRFSYSARQAIKSIAEEATEQELNGDYSNLLTVFCTVENRDQGKEEEVVKRATHEIKEQLGRLDLKRLCLYPYAHLSSELATPKTAKTVLGLLYQSLKTNQELEVFKSPFGWYKSFKLSCLGHPLSELSREIDASAGSEKEATTTPAEPVKTREDIVKELQSRHIILFPDGEEMELKMEGKKAKHMRKLFKSNEKLKQHPRLLDFLLSEEFKGQPSGEPPSIKVMQGQELVDYESAADSGHFKLYPKGKLVFSLLKDWAKQIADTLGAIEIDTPLLYDWEEPDIREQVKSFHERHYMVSTPEDRQFVLRFAGDFGLFKMMKNATISYKQMPVRVYEFSKSFRYEKRGELSGLKRLRAFHMPDIHSFCVDESEGMNDYMKIYEHYDNFASATGVDYVVIFRVVEEFYQKYKEIICQMLASSGKPAFIELLSKKKHYWVIKHEFQGIDSLNGNCQLSTVQLDVDDSERYDITYVGRDGAEQNCSILHCSIGSIERWIFSLLENALKQEKPSLPLWLAPTQLRLLPVRDEFITDCQDIARQLSGFRVDIDDREQKIGRKIRDAEKEWVPLIIVYGEKEKEAGSEGSFSVRSRNSSPPALGVSELEAYLEKETEGFPRGKLPLPTLLTQRIKFR
jgi:threonyl-tRNA synthetase